MYSSICWLLLAAAHRCQHAQFDQIAILARIDHLLYSTWLSHMGACDAAGAARVCHCHSPGTTLPRRSTLSLDFSGYSFAYSSVPLGTAAAHPPQAMVLLQREREKEETVGGCASKHRLMPPGLIGAMHRMLRRACGKRLGTSTMGKDQPSLLGKP